MPAEKYHPALADLSHNESPIGPSPGVLEVLKEHSPAVHRYPDDSAHELRQALSAFHGLGPSNFLLGAGSNEVIDILLKSFLRPGDKVLVPFPTFSQYRLLSLKHGGSVSEVPLAQDFSFDAGSFLSSASGARVIFLCTPNNPTGCVIHRDVVLEALAMPSLVVVDEAYVEFSGGSVVDLVPHHDNLVVLRTFSKAYGLAGLRVGYGLASAGVIEKMQKVRNTFNVSSLAQKAALAALSDAAHLGLTVDAVVSGRSYLESRLGRLFKVYPSQANFLWLDVSPFDAHTLASGLLGCNIAVQPFGSLPGFTGSFLRVTVGNASENERLVSALVSLVSGH